MFRFHWFAIAFAALSLQAQVAELGPAPRWDESAVKNPAAGGQQRLLGPAAVGGWIDTSSRATVAAAWTSGLVNTDNIPMGWTGQVSACAAGDVSAAWRTAVQARINWFRGMAGVPDGIVFNAGWNTQNQAAALMMSANRTLNHNPPSNWTCYTAAGAQAASNSNICYLLGFGNEDPGCVQAYISDSGSNNEPVGHRRWLLYPQSTTMGAGDVNESGANGRANSIWVIDPGTASLARPTTRDNFVAWPPKGYVPYQTVYARWSLSYPNANFGGAAVTMSRNGSAVGVTLVPVANGYGENTLVWQPTVNLGVAGADTPVDVTVSNVVINGVSQTFQYRVIVFDPTAGTLGSSISVTINSSPSGRAVTVDGGNFQTPHTFTWTPATAHTLAVPTPQTASDTVRYVYQSWNHTATNAQTVSPTVNTTYNVNFGAEYKLTTTVVPAGSGSVTATPGSSSGFYPSGSRVTLNASANPPYLFSNWAGDAAGTNAQTEVVLDRGISATAVFASGGSTSSGSGLHFVPITPCRVADTRNATGDFGGPMLQGGAARPFYIPLSPCGVPLTARAYSLNITVVPSGGLGYLTVWPSGQSQPFVSTLNAFDGQVTANAAVVPAGLSGGVSLYATNNTHAIIDINGYFDLPRSGAYGFYPVTPCRIADTRSAGGTFGGPALNNSARSFPIRQSACGIPSGATAYVFNITAVPSGALGYISTWPTGQSQPLVSTLNALDGQVTANMAIVPAGTDGAVSFYASNATNLVVDITGYFGAPDQPSALKLYAISPCRLVDTRNPAGELGGPILGAGAGRSFAVTQAACGLPTSARGYSANFTVVPAGALGYLTTWPTGLAQPFVSTLNAVDGQVTANAAIVPAGTGAAISVFVTNPSHVVIDTNGYFAP